MSAAEERALVDSLGAECTGTPRSFDRGDVTIVMDMIRCGVGFPEIKQHLPGVRPSRLLAAYNHTERMRSLSARAFSTLLASPDERSVARCAQTASMLLPIPTFKVVSAVEEFVAGRIDAATRDARIESVGSNVGRVGAQALRLEQHLEHLAKLAATDPAAREEAVLVGREIYDPYDDSMWSSPFFLAPRPGALVPVRLRDLFGEKDQ